MLTQEQREAIAAAVVESVARLTQAGTRGQRERARARHLVRPIVRTPPNEATNEDFEELAAVLEYEHGLSRQDAERLAREHPFVIDDAALEALRAVRRAFADPPPRP